MSIEVNNESGVEVDELCAQLAANTIEVYGSFED